MAYAYATTSIDLTIGVDDDVLEQRLATVLPSRVVEIPLVVSGLLAFVVVLHPWGR